MLILSHEALVWHWTERGIWQACPGCEKRVQTRCYARTPQLRRTKKAPSQEREEFPPFRENFQNFPNRLLFPPPKARSWSVFGIKTQCSRRWWGASMQRAGRLAGGQNSRQGPDLIMGRRALARPSQKMARPPSEVAESVHSPHPPPPG